MVPKTINWKSIGGKLSDHTKQIKPQSIIQGTYTTINT